MWEPFWSTATVRGRVVQSVLRHVLEPILERQFADDFVIQYRTAKEPAAALEMVRVWTTERGLTLHPTKTKIVDVDIDGLEFLGYRFLKHRRFPQQKSVAKFKETIRSKTKRPNGHSLQAIIVNVNRTLRGWV